MFYDKKKKIYSEVSETNKNINSDYYNIFQSEFKKMFSTNQLTQLERSEQLAKVDLTEQVEYTEPVKSINLNNLNITQKPKFVNEKYETVELDNVDIFFINLFSEYVINKNNKS